MYSMEGVPRRTKANSGPMVVVGSGGSSVNIGECGGSNVNAGEHPKHVGKGEKPPLPMDICWRCQKP